MVQVGGGLLTSASASNVVIRLCDHGQPLLKNRLCFFTNKYHYINIYDKYNFKINILCCPAIFLKGCQPIYIFECSEEKGMP